MCYYCSLTGVAINPPCVCMQMEKWKDKWRITKMLGSATFERDFTRVKTSVLELKTALRDYLDEETQIRQENQLNAISSMHLQTHEK